jgi:hypothetical protein
MLAVALLGGAVGCEEKKPGLYIRDPGNTWNEITVGITLSLEVTLSEAPPATDKIYVEVENRYTDLASVDPMTLVYKGDAGEKAKSVKIKGLKAGSVTLTFTIRGTSQSRIFTFQVKGERPPGDFGLAPDYGPRDKGTLPDTARTVDQGATDKGAADKGVGG